MKAFYIHVHYILSNTFSNWIFIFFFFLELIYVKHAYFTYDLVHIHGTSMLLQMYS